MRFVLIFSMWLAICELFSVNLNDFGHIVVAKDSENLSYSVMEQDNRAFIDFENHILPGSALYQTGFGFLSLEVFEVGLPVVLRIFDENKAEIFTKQYDKMINSMFSDNKQYFAFHDGNRLVVLDLHKHIETCYLGRSDFFTVNNEGVPVFTNSENSFLYLQEQFYTDSVIRKFLFAEEQLYVFTEKSLYQLKEGLLKQCIDFKGIFFDAECENGEVYFSTKSKKEDSFVFSLFRFDESRNSQVIQKKEYLIPNRRTHTSLRTPLSYYEDNYEGSLLNTYGTIQGPFLNGYFPHRAMDFMGQPGEDVYAVENGYVKNIYTTGGDRYWQILISNENTNAECEGYLYVHLDEDSFLYTLGEQVNMGDIIGQLVEWSTPGQDHVHFSRIIHSGAVWDDYYKTPDNALVDFANFTDDTPPVLLNARNNDLLAFRDNSGDYYDPDSLTGNLKIIAKCYDRENYNYEVNIFEIGFSLKPVSNPDFVIFNKLGFRFDNLFYAIESNQNQQLLNTIYSMDGVCPSSWSGVLREYYYIISNSNGDEFITSSDQSQRFDTASYPDGNYIMEVYAKDVCGNTIEDEMEITLINGVGNMAPFISGIPDSLIIVQGEIRLFFLPQYIYDPGTDFADLELSFSSTDSNLSYEFSEEGELCLTANPEYTGEVMFQINATDDQNETSSKTIIVSIIEPLNIEDTDTTSETLPELISFPNPFNPSNAGRCPVTTIKFSLQDNSRVELTVYNLKGQRINTLVNRNMSEGDHSVSWDGVDDSGKKVSTGVYFLKLEINNQKRVFSKCVLLK